MPLTALEPHHEVALREMLDAFYAVGENDIPGYFPADDWTMSQIVEALAAWSRGEMLEAGWVPCSTVFLMSEDGDELIGLYNFRHHLTPSLERYGGHVGYAVRPDRRGQGHATTLLRGAMDFGRSLSVDTLILSCAFDNHASARVIEKCGGVLVERYHNEKLDRGVLLWNIEL